MESIDRETQPTGSNTRLVALASWIGTTIEWYDFFLFGTAAAVVFNKLFFPTFSPAVGTLIAFATLGIGYLARPIGGLVIAHFGDRIGRKAMLILTLFVMGTATIIVGLLPTYQTAGIWAPILLLVVRAVQGIGIGGEYGGAVLIVVEHAPRKHRGLYGSITQLGVATGLLLAAGVFSIFSSLLSTEQFFSWGWRIPFLLSTVLLIVGAIIRLKIAESPAFEKIKALGDTARMPLGELLRTQPKNTVLTLGQRLAEAVVFNIYVIYVLAYVTGNLGVPRSVAVTGTLIAAVIAHFTYVGFGALSDRIGRRPVYLAGTIFSALFAFPAFWLLNTRSTALIWLAISVAIGIGHAAMYGPLAALWTEQFRTKVRYSGISVAYQLGGAIGGGFAPLIASAVVLASGGQSWSVSLYVLAICLISTVAGYLLKETFRRDIQEEFDETAPDPHRQEVRLNQGG